MTLPRLFFVLYFICALRKTAKSVFYNISIYLLKIADQLCLYAIKHSARPAHPFRLFQNLKNKSEISNLHPCQLTVCPFSTAWLISTPVRLITRIYLALYFFLISVRLATRTRSPGRFAMLYTTSLTLDIDIGNCSILASTGSLILLLLDCVCSPFEHLQFGFSRRNGSQI